MSEPDDDFDVPMSSKFSSDGFKTASGNEIKVKPESLLKAERLLNSASEASSSNHFSSEVFKTASGKEIPVKSEAFERAKNMFSGDNIFKSPVPTKQKKSFVSPMLNPTYHKRQCKWNLPEDYGIFKAKREQEKVNTTKFSTIHGLKPSDDEVSETWLKAVILDCGPKAYYGCNNCRAKFIQLEKKLENGMLECTQCKNPATKTKCIYSLLTLTDFTGQLQVDVPHDIMQKFLVDLGYDNEEEFDKLGNLFERQEFFFTKMIKIRRREKHSEEWIAVEVEDVDWKRYIGWLKN